MSYRVSYLSWKVLGPIGPGRVRCPSRKSTKWLFHFCDFSTHFHNFLKNRISNCFSYLDFVLFCKVFNVDVVLKAKMCYSHQCMNSQLRAQHVDVQSQVWFYSTIQAPQPVQNDLNINLEAAMEGGRSTKRKLSLRHDDEWRKDPLTDSAAF